MAEEAAEDTNDPNLQARSYTGVFRIERRIRKINDFNVPMRSGLVPAQGGAFVAVLLLSLILWFALFSPLITAIFQQPPPAILMAMFLLGPPILATRRIGKPMPYGKTLPGWLRSAARNFLDDEWHRAGTPIASRKSRSEKILHITRTWKPVGEGAEYIADLARDDSLYALPDTGYSISPADELATRTLQTKGGPADLLDWVLQTQAADDEAARKMMEAADIKALEYATDHTVFGQVHAD